MEQMVVDLVRPWLIIGDLNEVISPNEKMEGKSK